MTFASLRTIALLTLLTTLLFFGIDYKMNPQRPMFGSTRVKEADLPKEQASIRLTLNHLCCQGCASGLEEALAPITWLDAPKVLDKSLPAIHHDDAPVAEYVQQADVAIKDVSKVDFVQVLTALRKHGFTAAAMQLSGVPHYRLHARLPHMCCPMCVKGTREALDHWVRTEKAVNRLQWFDSFSVDNVDDLVTFNPKINEVVDIMLILEEINTMGFEASELTLEVEAH